MGNTDREEFKQRMKNLDAEEQKIVIKLIPDEILVEELGRRLTCNMDKISQIRDIIKTQEA